jgi:CheY-like chemotaxis protein
MTARLPAAGEVAGLPILFVANGNFGEIRRMRRLFEADGYLAVLATDWYDALSLGKQFEPAAIVVDTSTEGGVNLETARLLRSDETLRDTPTLVLVADPGMALEAPGFGGGAAPLEILCKSIDQKRLLAALRKLTIPPAPKALDGGLREVGGAGP